MRRSCVKKIIDRFPRKPGTGIIPGHDQCRRNNNSQNDQEYIQEIPALIEKPWYQEIKIEIDAYSLENEIETKFQDKRRRQHIGNNFQGISITNAPPHPMVEKPKGKMVKFVFKKPIIGGSFNNHITALRIYQNHLSF